ncbi:MAG: hypothetical protein O3A10_06045 [Chloroflexi bacterium]|nr:hypothetical protein [Chloroflexota bacterium]MDA1145652.1 hypothetical protein [Chloroflexota bacterium]
MTTPPETPPETPPTGRNPASDDFPTGPAIGERLPEIALPDQTGALVNLEQARGSRRALVLFHRSVRW